MPDIASVLRSIIVEQLDVDESKVIPDAHFINDLGADSLDVVELVVEFEKEFNIVIPDEEADNIATVGEAIAYLEKNKK
ncbi:MAG: acyl carrier protein [Bacteroidota bacterium]